ncbi:gamma-glutamyltransferase [Nocardioides sp. SYSU D00038]|uniref:gamma-glutamyltransferase n=1 Tax=Nocardioides sp. SYSU D00038 TaxID=2812554 RepID=UPI001967B953|nr:gamma-glutamyltransferase [Nocardioides sp. SYSU D00038]
MKVLGASIALLVTAGALAAVQSPAAAEPQPPKAPTRTGTGGGIATVDPYASQVGQSVLKQGGNAVDAAVAAAAALGVTEPFSAGIGGGGYFVFYNAKTKRVHTIDGRETAPARMRANAFVDPATGKPYPFTPDLVTSGVSVGVPGTPATWDKALRQWGTWSLPRALRPATKLARNGFVVDKTFRQQTIDNRERFKTFTSTRNTFLRINGRNGVPRIGERFRNPNLARTYELLARKGVRELYRGDLAREIARATRFPPRSGLTDLPVPVGRMMRTDLEKYRALNRPPTHSTYRGHDVYGMRPSSSGGTTVAEALNILEQFDLGEMPQAAALHHYLEASALAFADRGRYVGDPAFTSVPLTALLSDAYGAERACALDPEQAATKPVAAGDATPGDGPCPEQAAGRAAPDTENVETTNLTVTDKWGNVVEYTLTIEQTGGSGIVVPGRGFLLNNELTDFSTVYDPADPNRIQPGKRPRSSMSPTIVVKDGRPVLALGSPGGSTIITTVLQTLVNRLDLGMTLPQALAAPRASQRNTADVTAEPAFIEAWQGALAPFGHSLVPAGDAFTSAAEIGAATAIEIGPGGVLTVVAEPTRRGGGSARVVKPN